MSFIPWFVQSIENLHMSKPKSFLVICFFIHPTWNGLNWTTLFHKNLELNLKLFANFPYERFHPVYFIYKEHTQQGVTLAYSLTRYLLLGICPQWAKRSLFSERLDIMRDTRRKWEWVSDWIVFRSVITSLSFESFSTYSFEIKAIMQWCCLIIALNESRITCIT